MDNSVDTGSVARKHMATYNLPDANPEAAVPMLPSPLLSFYELPEEQVGCECSECCGNWQTQ
jgi:hypothetical protein